MPLRLKVLSSDDPQGRTFEYEFDSDRAQILVGRRGGVDVLLPDARVSLLHARIERKAGAYFLIDDGSTNGTRLNGIRLPIGQRLRLASGDRLMMGGFTLQVELRQTELEAPRPESSVSMARRMVLAILERLGPGESQPSLTILGGPQEGVRFVLGQLGRTFLFGVSQAGDLRLDEIDMWRGHVGLVRDELGVTVREMRSDHGITLNGQMLAGARTLHDGDTLAIGGVSVRFTDPAEVYLKKLENLETPDEPEATNTQLPPPRGEWVLLIVAGVVTLISALGIWYVLAWR